MENIVLLGNQIKSLITIAEKSGLSSPVALSDVDDVLLSGKPLFDQNVELRVLHQAVHEIVYAPPRR